MPTTSHSRSVDAILPVALEYHRAGQLDRADELYRQLTAHLPNLAQVVHLRALVAHAKGQFDLAVRLGSQAAALDPDNPEYHNLVGSGYFNAGRYDLAIESYRRAISLNPHHADAYCNCSLALQVEGRLDEALSMAERAIALRPDLSKAYCNAGIACARLLRHQDALAYFRKTLDLEPDNTDVWRNLGHVYKELGSFEDAARAYGEVLKRLPCESHAVHGMAHLRRFTRLDLSWCAQVERYLLNPNLPAEDQKSLHFSLGKVYDDIGHYAVAFAHLQRGNSLSREPYDAAGYERRMSVLSRHFTPQWFANRRGFGSDSPAPIFIVGMFRSGTTLTEQIVSSHSQVFGAGELVDIERLRGDLSALAGDRSFPACLDELTPARTLSLANDYLNRRRSDMGGAQFFTDKMPVNFWNLGLIALLFPRAKIIHCVRDPRDTCFSCYATRFSSRPEYCSDLTHLGHYYRQYARMMDHWRRVLPMPILDVQYEELIAQQSLVTRRILEFCGLPWDDCCLRFFENARPVQTSSDWQVRQPLYSASVGRWRHYEAYLTPLFEALEMA